MEGFFIEIIQPLSEPVTYHVHTRNIYCIIIPSFACNAVFQSNLNEGFVHLISLLLNYVIQGYKGSE